MKKVILFIKNLFFCLIVIACNDSFEIRESVIEYDTNTNHKQKLLKLTSVESYILEEQQLQSDVISVLSSYKQGNNSNRAVKNNS